MADKLSSVENTVPFDFVEDVNPGFSSAMINWVVPSRDQEPAWWSPSRDEWLRSYWKDVDALKTAVGTFVDKTLSIPFTIQPVDHSINRHVKLAGEIDSDLRRNSGTIAQGPMRGLKDTLTAFVIDYLTQDNGAFMFIMGNDNSSIPIVGRPTGLLHLDSARCQRTGNPQFPVLYTHQMKDGIEYFKIHYTRIIDIANLSSPDADMYGVGVCPISCCTMAAGEIRDIYRYSQEKFGSRPPRQILYAETGATIEMLTSAIQHWQHKLDMENQTHFGGTLVVAPKNASATLKLAKLDLSNAPDGFDRQEAIMQDKAEVAAAFGLDLLDLAMAFGIQGQTRANADVQTRKGRGKGPGALIEALIDKMNAKYLPKSLQAMADNIDDDQDSQRAEIMNTRSQAYARQLQFGIRENRSTRSDMLASGEINQTQFEELELSDGRLPSGITVSALFHSKEEPFKSWLNLGVKDPTNIYDNESDKILVEIGKAKSRILEEIIVAASSDLILKDGKQAMAALEMLEKEYNKPDLSMSEEENDASLAANSTNENQSSRKIDRSELSGSGTERKIQSQNTTQDSLMKEVLPEWIDENDIDPYSLSEDEVERAIQSFRDSAGDLSDLLDAEVN
jgi:hypothetical protein